MGRWRGFLDSLSTTGGHIFVLLLLMAFGVVVGKYDDMMIGSTVVSGSFGALLMMFKPSGTNSEQLARAGVPYQPPQPPPDALHPPIVVAEPPLPPSTTEEHP